MKAIGPVVRNFGLLAALDLLFTASFIAMLSSVLGTKVVPTAALMTGLAAIRIGSYWLQFQRVVRPTEILLAGVRRGRELSGDALRNADELLQRATRLITGTATISWALSVPLMVLSYHLLVGPTELHVLEVWVVASLTLVGTFGPIGIVNPLLTWGLADLAGENHLLAAEHGIELERPQRSTALRIAVLCLCLAGTPTLLMMSGNLAAVDREIYATALQQAHALASEIRHRATEDEFVEPHLARGGTSNRITWFVVGPQVEPVVSGELPGWATPEWLASAANPSSTAPDRSYATSAIRLNDGRTAGAVVALDSVPSAHVAVLVSVLTTAALFGLVCAWLFARSISVPLGRAAALAQRAARQGDLSQIGTVPVAQLDDVGQVALNLNELLDGMRDIAQAAAAVGDGKLDVQIGGEGELPDAFRRMLEQLSSVVQEMHAMGSDLAGAAMEILAASQEQEAAATSHSTGMTEITQTMDSLSGSAAHVASAVQGVLENAERTLHNTDQMVARIDELTGHANRIGDILDVIREIAERTDLLALNGSLEASRAGEAGVGFSIVASEMRRLAERVTASVSDIKTLVADIRESGASTVVATEESKKLADGTTEAARKITLVTQQQQSSTEQVTQNVKSVAEVIQLAALATSETKESAEGLKKQADRLKELAGRFELTK
jgi:methyl-accepting chemotaxis protein